MFTGWRCYFTKSPEVTLEMKGFLTAVDLTAVSLIKNKIAHTIEEKIKEERFKLQDKTIGQVCFNNVPINKGL